MSSSAYTTVRTLGAGAFATVDLVRRKSDGRLFAAKKLLIAVASDDLNMTGTTRTNNARAKAEVERHAARQKILEEVRIMQALPQHPCIVGLEEVVESRDAITLILEYVPGGTLADKVYGEGKDFDPAEMMMRDQQQQESSFDFQDSNSAWGSDADFRKQARRVVGASYDSSSGSNILLSPEDAANMTEEQVQDAMARMARNDSNLDLFHSADRQAFRAMFDQSKVDAAESDEAESPAELVDIAGESSSGVMIIDEVTELHNSDSKFSPSDADDTNNDDNQHQQQLKAAQQQQQQRRPQPSSSSPTTVVVSAPRPAPLPESLIKSYLSQLSSAINILHESGIIHKDIKVHNCFVAKSGTVVKLGDFGIAGVTTEFVHALASTSSSSDAAGGDDLASGTAFGSMIASSQMDVVGGGGGDRGMDNAVIGTPHAMSPELLAGTRFDERVDVWALGVLAYELVAHHPPFWAGNILALTNKVISEPVPPLPTASAETAEDDHNSSSSSNNFTEISDDLRSVIMWMLTKEAPLRPHMKDVVDVLRVLNNGRDVASFIAQRSAALRAAAGGRNVDDDEDEAVEEMVSAVMSNAVVHDVAAPSPATAQRFHHQDEESEQRRAAFEESRRLAAANREKWKQMENQDNWQTIPSSPEPQQPEQRRKQQLQQQHHADDPDSQQKRNEAFWETRRAAEENRRRAREQEAGGSGAAQQQQQQEPLQSDSSVVAVASSGGSFIPGIIPTPMKHRGTHDDDDASSPQPLQQISSVGVSQQQQQNDEDGEEQSFLATHNEMQKQNEARMQAFFAGGGGGGGDDEQRITSASSSSQRHPVEDDDEFLNHDEPQMQQVISVRVGSEPHVEDEEEEHASSSNNNNNKKNQPEHHVDTDSDDDFVLEDEDPEEETDNRNKITVHSSSTSPADDDMDQQQQQHSSSRGSSSSPKRPPPPQLQPSLLFNPSSSSKHNRKPSFDAPFAINFCANCEPAGREVEASIFCSNCGIFLCRDCSATIHTLALFASHRLSETSPEQENSSRHPKRRNINSPPSTAPAAFSTAAAAPARVVSPSISASSAPPPSTLAELNASGGGGHTNSKYATAAPSTAPTLGNVPSAPFEGLGLTARQNRGGIAFDIAAFADSPRRQHEDDQDGGISRPSPPQPVSDPTLLSVGGDVDSAHTADGMTATMFTPMRVERVEPADTGSNIGGDPKKKQDATCGCCAIQ